VRAGCFCALDVAGVAAATVAGADAAPDAATTVGALVCVRAFAAPLDEAGSAAEPAAGLSSVLIVFSSAPA
jgi:hypothetical protein